MDYDRSQENKTPASGRDRTAAAHAHEHGPRPAAPVVAEALDQLSLSRTDVDFTCSGSSDFLAGQPFSFVMALDGPRVVAWSHHLEEGAGRQ